MMNFMDKLNCLIVGCATIFCICGEGEGVSPCEVIITVKRGTTCRVVPRQPLTISCPVTHCGESLEVTWCKFLNPNYCEPISTTQNVEIHQKYQENELISYLTFKQVSINDDGQYRCLIGNKSQIVSHDINVSFSGTNQGNGSYNDSTMTQSPDANKSDSWLPYLYICVSILLLITSLTVLTLLGFHGWKKKWSSDHTHQKETSTETIPLTPLLQTSVLKDIDCSSSAETTKFPTENQPAPENTARSQEPQSPTYATINHQQSWKVIRKQPAAHENDEETKYAVINLH